MKFQTLMATSALVILAACGGSNTPTTDPAPEPEFDPVPTLEVSAPLTDAAIGARAQALNDTYGDDVASSTFTAAADMPAGGGAAMTGVIAIHEPGVAYDEIEEGVFGQIDIVADFGNNTLDGTASNFSFDNGETTTEFTGELTLDADIDRSAAGFAGTVEGTLISPFDQADFDINVAGNFLGDDRGQRVEKFACRFLIAVGALGAARPRPRAARHRARRHRAMVPGLSLRLPRPARGLLAGARLGAGQA